ncbi:MAG: hypothetical protein WAO00_16575 [Chthoniobacterales bacterium]
MNRLSTPVVAAFFALTSLAVSAAPVKTGGFQGPPTSIVASYRFNVTNDIVNLSQPISVSALDSEGHVINGFNGEVTLSAVQPDGSSWPVSPATVQMSAGFWTGNITLPRGYRLPLQLRATDWTGVTGTSMPFDVMQALALKTADIVWDAIRNRIYASVPAGSGAYANQVLAIDPDSLQITGSVPVMQDPRKLALTSGGEALYVALDANGTIAKINPDSMVVTSTFLLGADSYGPLYAEDMCTVTGQPDVIVVTRYSKGYAGNPTVAAYENGVMRPHLGYVINRIEPSADPAIFFGYESTSSGFTFQQLRLAANGISPAGQTNT